AAVERALAGSGNRSMSAREERVTDLTRQLAGFVAQLKDLEDLIHSAEVAREAIEHPLPAAEGRPPGSPAQGERLRQALLWPTTRLSRQMRSDLGYYQSVEARGRLALESERTQVEIDQTRIERLVAVALGVAGAALAIGTILAPFVIEVLKEPDLKWIL